MAEFNAAYSRTMHNEGGYSNDPDDAGGETYRGISRVAHPDWPGWDRVDRYKVAEAFPRVLDADHALKGWIRDFYRDNYWVPVGCHLIEDQRLADFLFDYAVHAGTVVPVKHLQRALNALNNEGHKWPDLDVDGRIGPATRAALGLYPRWSMGPSLFKAMCGLRTVFYIEIVERREKNEKYLHGWLNRLRG